MIRPNALRRSAPFNSRAHAGTADLRWLMSESWQRRQAALRTGMASSSTDRACAEPLEPRRLFDAGDLDTTFGGDGRVISDLQVRGGIARDVVVQGDGKIVALIAGRAPGSSDENQFIVARYNANGTPDTTFSGDGRMPVVFDGNAFNTPTALALQGDGKIVAVGSTRSSDFSTPWSFAITRLNANGTFDTTFSDDGRRTVDFGTPDALANAVALGSGGKIVVAGVRGNQVAVLRLNANGLNDSTFDGDAKQTIDFSGSTDVAYAVTVDGSQRVIIAGTTSPSGGHSDLAIARLTSGGALDSSFAGGRVETDFFSESSSEVATSLAIQADGRIVAGGLGAVVGELSQFLLARYNTNGTLDGTFDGDGRVETDPGGFLPTNHTDVLVLGDQRIVFGGSAADPNNGSDTVDFRLYRYSTTGQPDATFGQGGVARVDFYGQADAFHGMAAVPGGGFLVAGAADYTFNGSVPAFARLDANGDLVASFGVGGRMTDGVTGVFGTPSAAARQGDKTIVIGSTGRLETDSVDIFVARYNADGSLDTTFGTGGYAFIDYPSSAFTQIGDLAVQADGKIVGLVVLANAVEDGQDTSIFRLTANGQLDAGFATGGIYTTSFGRFEGVGALAIAPDQKIVATGTVLVQGTGQNDTTLIRLTTSGTPDNTFDGDGKVQIDLSGVANDDRANDVLVMTDGRILLAGSAQRQVADPFVRDDQDYMAARLTSGGALDPTFGNSGPGVFRLHVNSAGESLGEVELLADGRILVGGSGAEPRIMRLTSNGQLDTGFGTGNTVFPQVVDRNFSMLVQPDGKIVIAGGHDENGSEDGVVDSDFALERFLADGQVDASFGNNGAVVTDFGGEFSPPIQAYDVPVNVFYTADDKLLAVGGTTRWSEARVAMARYLATDGATTPTDPTTPSIAITGGVLVGRGTGGNDTITIRRTGSDDVIVQINGISKQFDMDNFSGGVRLEGLGGNDRITVVDSLSTPVARRVTLDGGAGSDTLTGNDGHDSILGGAGDDTLVGGPGNDTLDGGDGTDFADGDGGSNTHRNIEAFAGGGGTTPASIAIANRVLTATGTANADTITIERTGTDDVIVKVGTLSRQFDMDDFDTVLLQGLGGNDTITVLEPIQAGSLTRKVTLEGGAGNDTLLGNGLDEVLRGGDGDDHLEGAGGPDALFGNAGNDSLFGGVGQDFIDGGEDDDLLDASDGAGGDTALGGDGNDTAEVDAGDEHSSVETLA
jgi:uncharacterized delta-60 repeat protein